MFSQKTHLKKIGTTLLAGVVAFCLLLLMTMGVFANTVHVYDNAGVLNASQVQSNAANLPYPIDIYTVKTFNGDSAAFQQQTASHTANNSGLIVMAIDTVHHFLAIKAGTRVPLSNNQVGNAINAFKSSYGSGDYNAATSAALNSLQSSLNASSSQGGSSSNGGALPPAQPQSGGLFGGIGFSTLCCIGLLILAGVAVFAFIRRRSQPAGGFGWFNRRRANFPVQDPYYNQGYNQGYPPNYGPGYPGYNQGGGMNPWAAGGLGAAAGGLVGYELGKEAGEQQGNEQGNQGNDYSNNNGGDFGGGASGDFGGGNNGGDFGGGGGGDFGGGGGGGDFGGGGSGSF